MANPLSQAAAVEPPADATGSAPAPRDDDRRRPPRWTLAVLALALVAVALGAAWGIRGLFGNPVKGTDSNGITTVEGDWEPITCGTPCAGLVQDGGRQVTVVLPSGCPAPPRSSRVTVRGRLDPSQGKETYAAVGCAAQ